MSGRDDEGDEMASGQAPRVAVFAPHPLLTVTIEPEGPERQSIHLHAGGQGVWVARMIAALGATPMFCAMLGGETGELLEGILARALPEARLHIVACAAASGCYVTDRRSGERKLVALSLSDPPSRHELDELFSLTCAQALACGRLVVTNPMPASALPLEIYGDLVADARANGCQTFVDLSSPRLDSALRGEPDVVKLNDWELAEFVRGPVAEPEQLLAAAESLRAAGAHVVIVTRGEQPAVVLDAHGPRLLTPPRFEHGHREGCGDAMMGALAGALACGESFDRALRLGAAAGAANFLRHGLGSATHEVVERLLENVTLKPWPQAG
ncbi:MAG TPA: PfkB family carbohydrate kinase, partial [Solirubrobacteraceae bacterium]|nr:PfkB family carbohydrate kinase [Solirubrobacteraceae bacterium]